MIFFKHLRIILVIPVVSKTICYHLVIRLSSYYLLWSPLWSFSLAFSSIQYHLWSPLWSFKFEKCVCYHPCDPPVICIIRIWSILSFRIVYVSYYLLWSPFWSFSLAFKHLRTLEVMNFRMTCLEVFMLPSALLARIASMIMSEYFGWEELDPAIFGNFGFSWDIWNAL